MKQKHATDFGAAPQAPLLAPAGRWRNQGAALALAGSLQLMQLERAHGENWTGYRYESYKEDNGRIRVETQAFSFQQRLRPWVEVKGEVVYDAISGASPTGAPPPSTLPYVDLFTGQPVSGLSTALPVVPVHDIRWSGGVEPTFNLGAHHITPGFSYSEEHDYISTGASLNYSLDLNEKNTTLNAGWSHNSDKVYKDSRRTIINGHKDADEVILGVNQLLGPKTVLTVDFTYGNARGYLSDPYKVVARTGTPVYAYTDPVTGEVTLTTGNSDDNRPRHRDRYIGYASLTQAVTPLNASVEGSYRLFLDSWGISAHTMSLTWFQKIGKHVTLAPSFRYYRQTAADFYYVTLPGMSGDSNTPANYSSDYRLSALESFAYGVSLSIKPVDWMSIEASYKRYEMFGLDSVTMPSAYPKANVVSIGFRLWF